MEPVTIGAVLLAIVGGASTELGTQLWEGLTSLLRLPLRRNAASGDAAASAMLTSGEAELAAFRQAPDNHQKAVALAKALLARAGVDDEFRQALESWWQEAEPIRMSIGTVGNTISGGIQQGPVLQGRDFSNITFGTSPPSPGARRPDSQGDRALMTDPAGGETRSIISGGTQGTVLQGRDFRDVHIGDIVQAAAAPAALSQLPALAARFTGRNAELAQIKALLDPAGDVRAVVVSAVAGLAGVGKTALAVHASHRAREAGWFPGGVLFIDLHGYDDASAQPAQALDALLRVLGVAGEHIPAGTEQRAALHRSALAQISDPVLIVADNASSEAQVRPLLPGPGRHRVLVTSRHTLAGLGARLLDVSVLDDDTAVALLDTALRDARPSDDRIGAERPGAVRLARICGGLPLALQITAALLKADALRTVSDLADELDDEVRRLEALHYDDGGGTSAPSVAAAFDLSHRKLHQPAARLFRLLPVNPGPDVSTAAAAVLAGLPVSEVRRLLGQLLQAHLIGAATGATGRWQMHDLLRVYARQLADDRAETDGQEQARDRLLSYYLDTTRAAHANLRGEAGLAPFTGNDSALAWLDAERANLIACVAMTATTGRDQIAMALPLNLGLYLDWRRRFDEMLSTSKISRDAARRVRHRGNEASALVQIGNVLAVRRQFEEAILAFQDAAAIFQATGDQLGETMALSSIGSTLQEMGRAAEAIPIYQDAVAVFQRAGDPFGKGIALDNLGRILRDTGHMNEAIAAHQDALVLFQETGARVYEGMALDQLAVSLRAAGRVDEAIGAHQNALVIFRETGARYQEGAALANLGIALRDAGRVIEAIAAHQNAVVIFQETGDEHDADMALEDLEIDEAAQQA
jgi:tetratricopeptide (TPR) repeat protein